VPTPLHLADEELRQLLELAEPVAYGQRREFLQAVAAALANCEQPRPGATYRIARDVQRRFVRTSQRVAPEPPSARKQGRVQRAAEGARGRLSVLFGAVRSRAPEESETPNR
jgi:hypothetical protein